MENRVTSEDEDQNATPAPSGPATAVGHLRRVNEETAAGPRDGSCSCIPVGRLAQCGFDTTRALVRLARVGVNRHES